MARFQLERGPIPLHHQVFRDLKSALETGIDEAFLELTKLAKEAGETS